jgi:hypothetical protein
MPLDSVAGNYTLSSRTPIVDPPPNSKLSQTECATNQRPGAYSSVDSGELLPASLLDQGSLVSEGHSSSWQPPSSMVSGHLGKRSFGVYIGTSHLFCGSHSDLWPWPMSHMLQSPPRTSISHPTTSGVSHSCPHVSNSIIVQTPDMSTHAETHSVACSRCSLFYYPQ